MFVEENVIMNSENHLVGTKERDRFDAIGLPASLDMSDELYDEWMETHHDVWELIKKVLWKK